ncbi:unnamed protein product [Hapterophycus canaliculatus]
MRARAPPRRTGLLNGHYDKRGGKAGQCRGQTLAKLAGSLFLVVWVWGLYRYCGSSSSAGTAGSQGWVPGLRVGDSTGQHFSGNEDGKWLAERRDKHSRHKRPKRGSPVCTASPLQEMEAFPVYGCDEMDIMLEGKTKYLGRGYWREVRLGEFNGQEVAIKTLRDTQEESKRNKERHRWEAVALDMVKHHPNVVHLLGLCECDMVTEYFSRYMDVLLLGDSSDSKEELREIPIREVIRMALEAARGIQALHEMPGGPVVHADLQPRQLLLDDDGVVKVNDLNRCRFMGKDEDGEPCPFKISKGNGVWRSPEEYAGEDLTEKLDIYSLGNIFWAMLGRRAPFVRDDTYKGKVLKGERPEVDPVWHPEFVQQLFRDMWERDPKARPDAREVVIRLEKMYAELPPNPQAQS